jgi:hypothetical protein
LKRGYEGLVEKYTGGPTRRWLKVKQQGWTLEERWVGADQRGTACPVHPETGSSAR